jgi:hypothetical protein
LKKASIFGILKLDFMKKLLFLPLWFISSILFTGVCILGIQKARQLNSTEPLALQHQADAVLEANYTVPEGEVKGLSTVYELDDARPEIVASFLKRHSSPMTPHEEYGKKLVEIADKYEIDYRLLPAIAMQESNLCKRIPENSFNCLGFGVTATSTLRFASYEEAFDKAASGLKRNYIDKGLTTPEKIMTKYTPSSNGSWANSVNQWIAEMEYNDRQLGRELKTDADLKEYVASTEQ